MARFAFRSKFLTKLRHKEPTLRPKTKRRLQFQIPVLLLTLTAGFIWTCVHGLLYVADNDEEAMWPRQLAPAIGNGECKTEDEVLMEKSLDDEFIMVEGSVMLKYRDPYNCDEIILPAGDDSDDEDCILELGQGRRRRDREKARERARLSGQEENVLDDVFERRDGKCQKLGIGNVRVSASTTNQISSGAQPIIKSSKMGWFVWYAFCIFYMFIALAIVCDEFFVPALECFVDEFSISMDVAGATFMAAGGSMPELFTSFIATFQESEVGFVAIVGSAVFNVLFVIAVCAICAKETLELTWWPLFRDCVFYVIALLTVAFVFAVSSKNEIEWWEAIILLLEYILYCSFMTANSRVHLWIERKFHGVKVEDAADIDDADRVELDRDQENVNFTKPSTFRTGVLQLMTKSGYLHETAGIAAVTKIRGDLEETFLQLDKDKDGRINPDELKELLKLLGLEKDSVQIKTVARRISRSGDEFITFENFKRWYISSEIRIEAELQQCFENIDKNSDGQIEFDEVKQALTDLGHKVSDLEVTTTMHDIKETARRSATVDVAQDFASRSVTTLQDVRDTDLHDKGTTNDNISFTDFETWYHSSMFYKAKQESHKKEEEEGEGLDLNMPEDPTWCNMTWYVLTYPLCAILYCTLPDVRTEKYQRNWKWAVVEFVLSLVWIGIFSNWLYECIVVVSNTLRIPVAVSAVTFLAGGTSVPDLISSYVVARNGQGDMAVSSSIGSNIFDVTVGLPLPWLLYTMVKGKPFSLGPQGSKGLGFSIILLVLMLAAVIGTIMCMRWKMTKGLGVTMLLFYVIYVVQYLLQKLPATCNADETGVFQAMF